MVADNKTGKIAAVGLDQLIQVKKVIWRENDFPYYFEDGIEHHLLWATYELTQNEINDFVKQNREPSSYEYIVFVNPTILKSIPSVCVPCLEEYPCALLQWHCIND